MAKQYETVIGLEVHIELSTESKIFCGCPAKFGGEPNTHTCPVCTGMPGALPVLNRKVAEYALKLGLAANCEINRYCRFDRKNYFYPDNPQNYQISQLYLPICYNGYLEIETSKGKKKIRIHEMHMEEDAGKLIHDEWEDCSLVDYNRSGVPLVEIVSEPDMSTAEEVIMYLEKLRMLCRYLGISDCKLQEGSMRADVNLSVCEAGCVGLGTRTEMKNLNSFKAITHAIEGERERQIELLESGKSIIQETRRWDDNKECSYAMRSKEDAKDYRYFPDPDIPPVRISEGWIGELKAQQPEFQKERSERFQRDYGLPEYDSNLITQSRHLSDIFEQTAKLCGSPKKTANWLMGEGMRFLKEKDMEPEELHFSSAHLAELIKEVERGKINQQNAKMVFGKILESDVEPAAYMKEHGLLAVTDDSVLRKAAAEVLAENVKAAEEYRGGKEKVLGFLVGQVMKKMRGKADPGKVREIIERLR
ncbi:MAG: Asp-tRNA(Asn)/Glu-tRNA(Gln) amidotransferase subunit GatB [Dorea sp.]|nr:Asp-tRNA(Asn)/Glu-tRNA(Gln) amidotransferase subunit GatB [Dorea sp.]